MRFKNREEAGLLLSSKLIELKTAQPFVLGIARGGFPVARIIAQELKAPLDILVIQKISPPFNPELALGAVGPEGIVYWDQRIVESLALNREDLRELNLQKEKEQKEKESRLRGSKSPLEIKGRVIILADDGVATGSTVICAQKYLRKEGAKEIILAVPVGPEDVINNISKYFDRVIILEKPKEFYAVGEFYDYFPQIQNEEIIDYLKSLEK